MTRFSSQRVNNDPGPWRLRYCSCEARSRSDNPGNLFEICECGYSQENYADLLRRSEYNLDNNPNPILVAFREYRSVHHSEPMHKVARRWLAYPSIWVPALDERRAGDMEHARKVLNRLVEFQDRGQK